jgi:hypothetical protein
MFAIVQNNEIVKTGSIKSLFPNVSFPAGGASAQFKADNGVVEVVAVSRKTKGSTGSLLRIHLFNWWAVFQHSCSQTHLKS